jgi:hypothetical protein
MRLVQRLGNSVGYSHGVLALILDRLLVRPDICAVGADRASVMRCRGRWCLLLVAAVAVTVAVRPRSGRHCPAAPGVRLVTACTVEGMAPYPGQARSKKGHDDGKRTGGT